MVICKYYQQGTCRFGDNCKFEHQISGDHNYVGSTSILLQNYGNKAPQQGNTNIDTNTLIKSVVNDMTLAEKGGQWLLSSYSPFKEKAPFPGFEDQSMEEIRYLFYEAVKNGTVEQFKHSLQMMLQQAVMKIKALQNPSPEAVNILKQIYNAAPVSSTSVFQSQSNAFGGQGGTGSLFGGATQTQQKSVFNTGFNQSIFGGQAAFGGSQPPTAGSSVFGGAQSGSSAFNTAQSSSSGGSMFAGAQPGSIFGGGSSSNSPFGQESVADKPVFSGMLQQQSVFNAGAQQQPVFSTGAQPQPGFSAGAQPQPAFNAAAQPQPAFNAAAQPQSGFSAGAQPQPGFSAGAQPQPAFSAGTQPQPAFNVGTHQQTVFNSAEQQKQSVFNSGIQQQQPLFTSAASSSHFGQANPFGQQPVSTGGFEDAPAIDGAKQAAQHTSSIFGGTALQLSGSTRTKPNEEFYSKIEDLSEEDIKWFQSSDLDITNMPEKPPTYDMCFK